MARHECKRFDKPWRGFRFCTYCRRRWTSHGGKWEPEMSLRTFADKWLPAISGTQPEKMMVVDVAFPFEWNTYESWNIVHRVRFDFTDVLARNQAGLGTPVDVMNGWRSAWAETFNKINAEALAYFEARTGRAFEIGDNTYAEMRRLIQS